MSIMKQFIPSRVQVYCLVAIAINNTLSESNFSTNNIKLRNNALYQFWHLEFQLRYHDKRFSVGWPIALAKLANSLEISTKFSGLYSHRLKIWKTKTSVCSSRHFLTFSYLNCNCIWQNSTCQTRTLASQFNFLKWKRKDNNLDNLVVEDLESVAKIDETIVTIVIFAFGWPHFSSTESDEVWENRVRKNVWFYTLFIIFLGG